MADPLSDDLWKMWTERATTNTAVYRHLFHADPDDHIKTFEEYDRFMPRDSHKSGHLYDPYQPIDLVRSQLDKIQGHLVWMPLKFLEEAKLAEWGMGQFLAYNPFSHKMTAFQDTRELYADSKLAVNSW